MQQVDVIMPTRNRAAMTLEAVESVRRQTFVNWRLLLVDDASEREGVSELVDRLGEIDRVDIILRHQWGGPQAARETGWRTSTAPFIALLDSDDLWLPTKLERQLIAIADAEVALCGHAWLDREGHRRRVGFPSDPEKTALVSRNMSTPLLRREVIEAVGGFVPEGTTPLYTCEGLDFYLRLHDATFTTVDEVLVECRDNDSERASNLFGTLQGAEELASVVQRHASLLTRFPRDRGEMLGRASTRCFQAGHQARGWRLLAQASMGLETKTLAHHAAFGLRRSFTRRPASTLRRSLARHG